MSTKSCAARRARPASWPTKSKARILGSFDQKAAEKIDMYDLEHVALFNSIRDGKPINNGHYMANSTMLAIMGRMCTYTGQTLTWDECINSQERLGPNEYAWNDDVPEGKVAIPGKTKLV